MMSASAPASPSGVSWRASAPRLPPWRASCPWRSRPRASLPCGEPCPRAGTDRPARVSSPLLVSCGGFSGRRCRGRCDVQVVTLRQAQGTGRQAQGSRDTARPSRRLLGGTFDTLTERGDHGRSPGPVVVTDRGAAPPHEAVEHQQQRRWNLLGRPLPGARVHPRQRSGERGDHPRLICRPFCQGGVTKWRPPGWGTPLRFWHGAW